MVQQIQPFDFGNTLKRNRLAELAQQDQARQLDQRDIQLDQGQQRIDMQGERDAAALADRRQARDDARLRQKADIMLRAGRQAQTAEQFHILAANAGRGLWDAEDLEGLAQITDETFPTFKNNLPAGVQEFNALVEAGNLTPEERQQAARVDLGLDPRATGNAEMTLANMPQEVRDAVNQVRRTGSAATRLGDLQVEQVDQALKDIPTIRASIGNLNQAISAIDDGANTGELTRFLPSINEATILLEQAGNRLGLDVLNSATFGALSEAELRLALQTGLDFRLSPEELRRDLVRRRDAQQAMLQELNARARFLSDENNSLQDYFDRFNDNVPNRIDNPLQDQSGTTVEATEGTVISNGQQTLILQNGEWVPVNG